ncbi:sphingosine kinase 2-like isoform X1 [Aphis gossypii]|uniref:sphingosine kinase 2-like isoform X1 n=1 Tax=Aphis gossypii TaxID=80765 RepID=UPI00100DADE7|nr:sphingosine kinase 2-like isoform X1 [Aphis gossypii]
MDGNGLTASPILEETFYALSRKQYSYKVSLTNEGLHLTKNSDDGTEKTNLIHIRDIIGCKCMRNSGKSGHCACRPVKGGTGKTTRDTTTEMDECQVRVPYVEAGDCSAYLCVYAFVLKNVGAKNEKRDKMTVTLRFRNFNSYDENSRVATKWKLAIKSLLRTRCEDGTIVAPSDDHYLGNHLLVIVNPKSGVGKSREIFQRKIVPILNMADVDYDLHITCMQNDARNLMRTSNIYKWGRGVVVLGGDGLMFEVINGLMERSDWQRAFEYLTLAVIPGGSGNGMAKSISFETKEPYNPDPILASALNIVGGNRCPMDLVRVETLTQVVYSFLSIGWGFIADIDIESERLRMIGSPRFTIWSIARLIGLRSYPARLSYSKIDNLETETRMNNYTRGTSGDFQEVTDDEPVSIEFGMDPLQEDFEIQRERIESFSSIISKRTAFMSVNEAPSFSSIPDVIEGSEVWVRGPMSKLPPLSDPVPSDWVVVEDEFVMIHASYLSHISEDVILAPKSKLNDGVIWLLVIKNGISRTTFLQFLLGLSSGNHLAVPNVEMIPVRAFRLEPLSQGSHLVVDGELLKHSPVQAEIMPGITNVYARQKFS